MEEKKENTLEKDSENGQDLGQEKNRINALVAYIPFLCFVALFSKESDDFTRAHGRQGLLLLIVEIIAMVMLLPIGALLWKIILLVCAVLAVVGIVASFSGKPFSIPFIGKLADKI